MLTSGFAAANPPVTGINQIAPGGNHTCAVVGGGNVQCWGFNGSGQLGTGTNVDSNVAVDVVGLESNIRAVTSGASHTCAATVDGVVKCWGDNFYGQLGGGAGSPSPSYGPVDVPGLVGVVALSAGGFHTCALTTAGAVACWGNDSWGQTGGTSLTSGIVAIASGYQHACALTSAGGVKCWGANYAGQLGNGSIQTAAIPVDVVGLSSGVTAIASGVTHSCAVPTGGGVKCWGRNDAGQLGDGSTTDALIPMDVINLAGVTAVALGSGHSCALTTAGGVKCWGSNVLGELGNGTTTGALIPVDVAGLGNGVTAIASSETHTCAIASGGLAKCWGANTFGQLGNGTTPRSSRPVDVAGLSGGIMGIATGNDHSCALSASGMVSCWGRNFFGAVGNGTFDDVFLPVGVAVGSGVNLVRAGGYASCAVTGGGGVKCWGLLGTAQPLPTDVPGLASGIVDVALGESHACALTSAGGVKCWGNNHAGQLGNGSTTASATPVDVAGLTANVVAINTGHHHSCAIVNDGTVRCWGDNSGRQVTAGDGGMQTAPVIVAALTEAALAIDGGGSHTCVQTSANTMKCWGDNGYAQLGLDHQASVPGVFTVALSVGTVAVAAGYFHSCQIGDLGTVRCWGLNNEGQVGSGDPQPIGEITPPPVRLPAQVAGIAGATAIAAVGYHTCVLVNGNVKCWGRNLYGQLGNGVGGYAVTPQTVLVGRCGEFDDVYQGNPFCANVTWSRNRMVTEGCMPNLYCPDRDVSRLAMAAFADRLGAALAPDVVTAEQTPGAIDPVTFIVVCTTSTYPTGTQPRRIVADGVLRAFSSADASIAIRLVASENGGVWYGNALNGHGFTPAGRWSNHRALAHFDLPANRSVRFGLQVSRGFLPPGPALSDSSCNLRIRIDNRNELLPAFDPAE